MSGADVKTVNKPLPRGLVSFLELIFRKYPAGTALVCVCLFLAGLSEGIGIALLLPLVGMLGGKADSDTRLPEEIIRQVFETFGLEPSLGILLTAVVAVISVKGLLVLGSMTHVGYTAARIETEQRVSLVRALLNARWEYFVTRPLGSLANALTLESRYASEAYVRACVFVASVFQVCVHVGVTVLLSWQTALGAVVGGAITLLVLGRFVAMTRRAAESQARLLKSVSGRLVDLLQGIKPLKAMGRELQVAPIIEGEIRELAEASKRQVVSFQALSALSEPFLALIMAVGIYLAFTMQLVDLGSTVVLGLLFWRSLRAIGNIQQNYQQFTYFESAFRSLQETTAHAETEEETLTGSSMPTFEKGLDFRNVSFSYGDALVLADTDLFVPVGSFTALVGPSGVGKTTLGDLAAGLLRPQSGEIYVDDIPLCDLNTKAWRSLIGYVPQDPVLFHDTIRANVTAGDSTLSDKEITEALRQAGALSFTESLTHGLDTIVGERGAKLSGGQRQRIAIARALAHKPRLLILDEVTSSLDAESEQAICDTLQGLHGRVTVLAISHRPAIVQAATTVYSLGENGRITSAVAKTAAV